MTLRDIIDEVKRLPRDEQVDLLDEIYCMINVDPKDVALTPAQAADLEKRMQEARLGNEELIPGDEAIAQIKSRKRS